MGHIATRPLEMGILTGLNVGIDRGLLVSGDLTTKDAAKAAVDADVAKLHIAERLLGVAVKGALDVVDGFQTGYTAGTNATAYTAINGGANVRNFYGVFN